MSSILPPVPRIAFTIFEPLSLLAGFIGTIVDPQWFIGEQISMSPLESVSKNSVVVALQLGNMYLLLAMVGIAILYTSNEAKVVRNYLIALAIADVGHLAVTYYILEHEKFIDVANWNAMAWGNIAATVMLFLCRLAYLTGLFGPNRQLATKRRNE